MSDHQKTHNGRDVDGNFRVRQDDVEDLLEDPAGVDFVRDDVRLGGAIADTGPHAGQSGEHIHDVIANNRENVARVTGKSDDDSSRRDSKR